MGTFVISLGNSVCDLGNTTLRVAYSEDYCSFCEPTSSFLTQAQLRAVAHGCTLAYSFSRCLCLPSRRIASRPGSRSQRFENDVELPWTTKSPRISLFYNYPNTNATSSSGDICMKANFETNETASVLCTVDIARCFAEAHRSRGGPATEESPGDYNPEEDLPSRGTL